MNKLLFASVISEIQQSDIFMTVKARICEAPAANLNGARVTEAFISEIVDNKEQYVGLPLYADVRALVNGNYRRLGHLYDSRTGEFHSTQIGSFYDFEKEDFDGGCYLVGYARIAKRNKKLSNALLELFADGALKFSFEVNVGEYTELDDGTIQIDASDSNYLEGTAIVTFPACEDAVALELVAQQNAEQSAEADDNKGGDEEMADNKNLEAEQAVEQPVAAEEQPIVAEEENPEADSNVNAEAEAETKVEAAAESNTEETACKEKEKAETAEQAETAGQENAAVYIDETERVEHSTYAHDTESGVDVFQNVSVTTSVSHVEPEAQIVEADDGIHIAEDSGEGEGSETPTETPGEVSGEGESTEEGDEESGDSGEEESQEDSGDAADVSSPDSTESRKKTAEQLIAELAEVVESLRKEVAELKEAKVTAEAHTVTAEVNPMMADIRSEGRYSLLEKESKPAAYSLLSK